MRLLDAVLEELDYRELHHLYSSKGRKSKVSPHILFKIFVFIMSNGVYSTRMIQQQYEENINYMWLLQGYTAPSHMTFHRFFARCTFKVLINLFSQLMEAISNRDTLNFNEVFIDGTKVVQGKETRKTPLQRLYERAEEIYEKRKEYEMHLSIMGERNSHSKTDHDATFMRMKDDQIRNGQLKPAYNIQLVVHSEYIMGVWVFPNPNLTSPYSR